MADYVLAVLQQLMPSLAKGATVVSSFPFYHPPTSLPTLTLEEVRVRHRVWLAPRGLGCELSARPVPPPFAAEVGDAADGDALVLHALGPSKYAAAAKKAGKEAKAVQLAVEKHPAAKSVVARKMLRRLREDADWLAAKVAAGGAAPPQMSIPLDKPAELASSLDALLRELGALYAADSGAIDDASEALLARAADGGSDATAVEQGARVLATGAGSEPNVPLETLCALLMSPEGAAELQARLTPTRADGGLGPLFNPAPELARWPSHKPPTPPVAPCTRRPCPGPDRAPSDPR